MKRIYADWAAGAPLCPAAAEELRRWLADPVPANPSSVHSFGMDAADRLAAARTALLCAAGWADGEVTFVSGGTEGLALVVYSLVRRSLEAGRRRVILSPLEHPAVREAVRTFAVSAGMAVEECAVTLGGVVDPLDFAARLGEDVGFCGCMMVQNEVGVCQPVAELAALAHRCGAYFFTDGVQAAGHLPLRYWSMGHSVQTPRPWDFPDFQLQEGRVWPSGLPDWDSALEAPDALVISGHKFGAPAGIGAVLHRMPLVPLQKGGGQERGYRGGTENLPGICAMAAAAASWGEPAWMAALRDRLEGEFIRRMGELGIAVRVLGQGSPRSGTISCILFPPGVLGETLVLACDLAGLAVSAGSACHSSSPEPSPALLAMGLSSAEAVRAVRLSFGSGTTEEEMEAAYRILGDAAERLCAAGNA